MTNEVHVNNFSLLKVLYLYKYILHEVKIARKNNYLGYPLLFNEKILN